MKKSVEVKINPPMKKLKRLSMILRSPSPSIRKSMTITPTPVIHKFEKHTNRGYIFWEIMKMFDFYLLRKLIRNVKTTSQQFWDLLFDLIEESGHTYDIISEELKYEIETNSSEFLLLKPHSGAVMLFMAYLRKHFRHLLERIVNPIIQTVNISNDKITFNKSDQNYEKSCEIVNDLLNQHFKRFLMLEKETPEGMKYLLTIIKDTMKQKLPENKINVISYVIFTHIISQALLIPPTFNNSLDKVNDKSGSIFKYLTRIYEGFSIQGDAPLQESNLKVFNDVLKQYYDQMNHCFDSISQTHEKPMLHKPIFVNKKVSEKCCDKTTEILNEMESYILKSFIEDVKKDNRTDVIEYFLLLCYENWEKEELKSLEKPRNFKLFDEEIEKTYFKQTKALEKLIIMKVAKMKELELNIFVKRALLEEIANEKGLNFEELVRKPIESIKLPPRQFTEEECGLSLMEEHEKIKKENLEKKDEVVEEQKEENQDEKQEIIEKKEEVIEEKHEVIEEKKEEVIEKKDENKQEEKKEEIIEQKEEQKKEEKKEMVEEKKEEMIEKKEEKQEDEMKKEVDEEKKEIEKEQTIEEKKEEIIEKKEEKQEAEMKKEIGEKKQEEKKEVEEKKEEVIENKQEKKEEVTKEIEQIIEEKKEEKIEKKDEQKDTIVEEKKEEVTKENKQEEKEEVIEEEKKKKKHNKKKKQNK